MTLSDTAQRILTEAAQHPHRLASPPEKLPAAACRSVLNSLRKQGYIEECAAPDDLTGPRWRQQNGAQLAVRITGMGMAAIGAVPNPAAARPDTAPTDKSQEPDSAPLATPSAPEPPKSAASVEAPSMRPNLRDAAQRVLAAWDDEAGERAGLADAITELRAMLVKTAPAARTVASRKSREGTKQQKVLAMLRRSEGSTVAQIAEATGWQAHTVRGFFAGLKKRQGIAVEAAERVRQVSPGKEGAKGSYTVYRVAEAG